MCKHNRMNQRERSKCEKIDSRKEAKNSAASAGKNRGNKHPKTSEQWVEHILRSLPQWLGMKIADDAKRKLKIVKEALPGIPAKAAADATVACAKATVAVWRTNQPIHLLERTIATLSKNGDETFIAEVYERILDSLLGPEEQAHFNEKVTWREVDQAIDCIRKRRQRASKSGRLKVNFEYAEHVIAERKACEEQRHEMREWALERFGTAYGGPEAIARIFDGISIKEIAKQLDCSPSTACSLFARLRTAMKAQWDREHYGE